MLLWRTVNLGSKEKKRYQRVVNKQKKEVTRRVRRRGNTFDVNINFDINSNKLRLNKYQRLKSNCWDIWISIIHSSV